MKKEKAAAIYARTLLETAADQKIQEQVSADMHALEAAFRKLPGLHPFLTNPIRRSDEKAALVNAAAEKLSPLTRKFLKLLENKNRMALLNGIAMEYIALEEDRMNILRATVVSAEPMDAAQLEKLTRGLEAGRPGKTFVLTNRTDASLIAGFRIQQGDSVTDASIKHKLDLLKQKLAA